MMVCLEAAMVAVIGVCLGLLLGIFAAKFTMHGLARYFGIPPVSVSVPFAHVAITATGIALFIFLTALLPAYKASRILPVEFLHNIFAAHLPPRAIQKWTAVGLGMLGLFFLIAGGRWTDPVSVWHALSYVAAGFLASASLYLSTPFWITPVLRLLSPLLERIMGIESKIAVQNLIFHRAQSTLAVTIIGLSMTLVFPVAALFTWVEGNMLRHIEARYLSDIVVWSKQSMRSTVPLAVQSDLQRIPGVQTAIAASTNQVLILDDYDFAGSDPKWVRENSKLSRFHVDEHNRPVPEREVVNYKRVRLHALAKELRLPVPEEIDLENAGMITAHYAAMLGVKAGDTLEFIIPRFKDEPVLRMQVTIAAVLDRLYADEDVLILDWNNAALQPIEPPNVHHVLLFIDPARKHLVEQHLQTLLPKQYSEMSWSDKATQLQQVSDQIAQRKLIIGAAFVLLLMLGLCVMVNHLSAILLTKRREMRILRMTSATQAQIRKMVAIQCGLFGMIGVVLGVITGGLTTFCFSLVDGGPVFVPIAKQIYAILWVMVSIWGLSLLLGRKEAKAASAFHKADFHIE